MKARQITLLYMLVVVNGLALNAWGQRTPTFELAPGEPFGVGRLVLSGDAELAESLETNNLSIEERDGRILYPAFTTGKFRKLLGELLGGDTPLDPTLHVMFLYRGSEPLQVTVRTPEPRRYTLEDRPAPPRVRERLMLQWWREYNAVATQQTQESDYPPIAQTYLTAMLSRRTGLPLPAASTPLIAAPQSSDSFASEAKESIDLLLGVESLRLATIRDAMLRPSPDAGPANQPLPPPIQWGPAPALEFDPTATLEPLSQRVPEDWFYIRFGRLANQTWLDKLTAEHGGDLGRMITLRGLKDDSNLRIETQLALPPPKNALEEVVGDAMIADCAMVGRDIYLEDGAAVGMLFQVRSPLFVNNLRTHRREVVELEKDRGATLEEVTIADKKVSLLSTPDHRLRSFMVVDGDFLLVTTSQSMVEQFYAVAKGPGSLAQSAEFRQARTLFPVTREDTIFAYFSSAFFRGLLSPQYQIEVARRLRVATDLQIAQLAALAANAEGLAGAPASELERDGLLPTKFGTRADGGRWQESEGRQIDSVRGAIGVFLPVPDVPIRGVTRAEADRCARRAAFYESRWKQMDPLIIAVKRHLGENDRERIEVNARLALLDESKYGGWLSLLGPPSRERVVSQGGEPIFIQAHLRGGLIAPRVPPHHMVLGIYDAAPLTNVQGGGFFQTLQALRTTPGYLVAWPKPGFLDLLPFNLGGTAPDAQGFSRLPLGVWRRQWEDYSAVAFDTGLLGTLPQNIQVTEDEHEAQIRVHVADLSEAKLAGWVNNLSYERARQSSVGNVKLLHLLHQQLGVPYEEARETAEQLLNAQLVCPLDGEYELTQRDNGALAWQSSAWPNARGAAAPDDYESPILSWFRGLDARLAKHPDHIMIHAEIQLQRQPTAAPANEGESGEGQAKPFFNFNIFGGSKPDAKPDAKPAEKPKTTSKPTAETLPTPRPEPDKPKKQRDF
jgi:hypothetical protein